MVSTTKERDQRGMTLVEVMVALIVASIGLLGTLALMGTIVRGGDYSRRITEGSVLLQYKLEEDTIIPYASLQADASTCASTATSGVATETLNALGVASTGLPPGQSYTRLTY